MSQWGEKKVVNGAVFVPHVRSGPFQPIAELSPIDSVLLIDDGGNRDLAIRTNAELTRDLGGKPYKAWLDLG